MEVKANQAIYVLGFSKTNMELVPEIYWLKSAEVTSCVCGDIRYWFRFIDRSDFEGTDAEANLSSLAWLTPRVLAHDAAVSGLSKIGPFYPTRFGTLFSSHDAIAKLLDVEKETLTAFFASVEGREEWGIKCVTDRQVAIAKYAEKEGIDPAKPLASGKDYLKSRQVQKTIDGKTRHWLTELTQSIQKSLQEEFGAVVLRPRLAQPEGNEREELVGNMAVLPTRLQSDDLGRWVENWNESQFPRTGLRLDLTGPWPPYSFCPSLTGQE
jgi:hypothetical protein